MTAAFGADEFHPLAEVWKTYLEDPKSFQTDPVVKAAFEAATREILIQRGYDFAECKCEYDDNNRIAFTE